MKLLYISIIAILAFGLSACDDFLTLNPEDTLSPDTYFSSENELRLWTNSFYAQMDEADGQAGQNADDNIDNALGAIMEGQRDPSSENGWNWSMLRKINYYLQNSHNCTDLEARNHYDGVAYFMRAYFYFKKVQRYGDVPWYNQVIGSADEELLYKPRDSRELVMDSVMADLDNAISMLRTSKSVSTVTKWTALALKTRAALYEGTYRKYHNLGNADKYLKQVVDAGKDFIANSGYGLYNEGDKSYRDLFISDDAKETEVILTRIYSIESNLRHGIPFNISNMRQGFTKDFMNHYLMANGTRISDNAGWETIQYPAETVNRDPRMAQTVLCPGYIQPGTSGKVTNDISALTGYKCVKFMGEPEFDGAAKAISDWPLFRTAEVYLNYAEAKAELNELSQADLDISINKIRQRANMPGLNLVAANGNPDPFLVDYYSNVTQNSNTGVLLEIRRERTIELALEGFRQWDLLRWKEGQRFVGPYYGCYFPGEGTYDMDNDGKDDLALWVTNEITIPGGTSKQIGVDIKLSDGSSGYVTAFESFDLDWNEERDYLWPIPTDERVLSGGVLSQNPGWKDSSGY
ncbi:MULTISPECIES: RagB/SusD family nutrient uptake outer membrane protein [unclassified Carboxylicivirga]|uniref:RagB/SusD family nutrient uptake outer membrane protein n=1 Tax=Carboxylicivirga TaxID=1628153 RepID=UPI003D338AE5